MSEQITTDQALSAIPCAGQDVTAGLKEIVLIPWGTTESKRGTMVLDQAGADSVVAAFEAHKTPIPIDFEHQSLGGEYSSPDGKAPAAGWIHRVWAAPGLALKGLVEWTEKARSMIRAGEYRYLSPVAIVERATKRVVGLHSAGLTNLPAIPGLARVAASAGAPGEKRQDAQVETSKSPNVETAGDTAIACAVREALGLPADAPQAAIELAIRTRGQDNSALELAAMREQEAQRVIQESIDGYVTAGRLNPRDLKAMSAARELARTQPELLAAILTSPVAPVGKTTAPSPRSMLIGRAAAKYRGEPKLAGLCSLQAFVAQELKDGGHAALSDVEARELAVG